MRFSSRICWIAATSIALCCTDLLPAQTVQEVPPIENADFLRIPSANTGGDAQPPRAAGQDTPNALLNGTTPNQAATGDLPVDRMPAADKVSGSRRQTDRDPNTGSLNPGSYGNGEGPTVPQDFSYELVEPAEVGEFNDNRTSEYGPDCQPEVIPGGNSENLTLADVIASLYRSYPVILQSRLERPLAQGMLTEAFGAYDTKLNGYTLNEPTGFYRNYRQGVGVARQTWWGGYVAAGYRIGRGVFQPWYLERETNKAGEFKLAFAQPLLQGRAIDPQRVAVFQASIDNRAVEPQIQEALLNVSFEAALVYWDWVSAGGKLMAQRELLQLALIRENQIEAGVEADKFAEVDLVLNQQLIAERRGLTLAAEQKFRETGFKLSLFLRDERGQPIVPNDGWLPNRFPRTSPIQNRDFNADLADALTRRPETRLIQLEIQRLRLDRQLASNDLLPRVDIVAEGSQDIGTPTSSKNDKGEFELLIGLQSEVPIQRRKARGKLQSTSAKIAQVSEKLRLQSDKIGAELQTAFNNLVLAADQVAQANLGFEAAIDTLDRFRFAFERGKTDLIQLNILEQKANEIEIKLIEAQRLWFSALADLQRALGLDPLEQAIEIAELPPSDLYGPNNMPAGLNTVPENFDNDWEARLVPREEVNPQQADQSNDADQQ